MIEAVLRTHYRFLRTLLAMLEQHLPHHLARGFPIHSVCRQVLIACDCTAAYVLHDGSAARAADRIERCHTSLPGHTPTGPVKVADNSDEHR